MPTTINMPVPEIKNVNTLVSEGEEATNGALGISKVVTLPSKVEAETKQNQLKLELKEAGPTSQATFAIQSNT